MKLKNLLSSPQVLLVLLFVVSLAGMYWYMQVPRGISIQLEDRNKIVYEMPNGANEEMYARHCLNRGGKFNPCGSPCAPGSEGCIAVCAAVCDLSK